MAGYTGSISVSGALSGGGQLEYVLNGSAFAYSGPITVPVGATLGWGVVLESRLTKSGTLTVTDNTHSTTLAAIPYTVIASTGGE